jgi:flagellin
MLRSGGTDSLQGNLKRSNTVALSILNNIPALEAENALSATTASANASLQQLATGSRINSGSDDAAGLAISDGLNANVAALNQSSLNTTNAVGSLQTADGAMSEITTLLNRSVTLATEASSSGLSSSQSTAMNTEYQSLLKEIDNIASNTAFNGSVVFGNNATTAGNVPTVSAFTSDGTNNVNITAATVNVGTVALGLTAGTAQINNGTTGATVTTATSTDLTTAANAQTALAAITSAINTISANRGTLGATVEQLQAASTVDTQESTNLASASSNITSADMSKVVANDTKYSVLEQTGVAALQQANQQSQNVLKLLQ